MLKTNIAVLITFAFFSTVVLLIIASIVNAKNAPKEEEKVFTTTKPLENNFTEQQRNPSRICEYVDVMHEDVAPIDVGDNIQENIGYQNNKVGLYIYAEVEEFTDLAAEMVNSNGGDWGYVLIPYNVKDYDEERWGKLFERLSDKHLIPIIQLWDLDLENEDEMNDQIKDSAEFLNSLKWPIEKRYISVYNEPNDAKFWKGDVNPEQYAEVLEKTINAFDALNNDFFIMNGAFNTSARTGGDYLDTEAYMIRMNNQVPGIFKRLDGWASHPYPQPNFSGSPNGKGRDSIRAYDWELAILERRFDVEADNMPIFITETGWAHKESDAHENGERVDYYLNQHQVADNFKAAFENVWLPDKRIVAVTPFTIRYNPPHDHFSWVNENNEPYPQYHAVKDVKKEEGRPPVVSYIPSRILDCKPGPIPETEPVEPN